MGALPGKLHQKELVSQIIWQGYIRVIQPVFASGQQKLRRLSPSATGTTYCSTAFTGVVEESGITTEYIRHRKAAYRGRLNRAGFSDAHIADRRSGTLLQQHKIMAGVFRIDQIQPLPP